MGQIPKEERFRKSLTPEQLQEEDEASRSRWDGYWSMPEGIARTAALDSEQEWRMDLGLDVLVGEEGSVASRKPDTYKGVRYGA